MPYLLSPKQLSRICPCGRPTNRDLQSTNQLVLGSNTLNLHLITNTSTFGHCSPPITVPSVIGCFALTGVPSSWVCETTWPSRSERNPHGLLITLHTNIVPSGEKGLGSIFLGCSAVVSFSRLCKVALVTFVGLLSTVRGERTTQPCTGHRGEDPHHTADFYGPSAKRPSKDWATNTEMCCPAFLRSLRSAGLVLWTRFSW